MVAYTIHLILQHFCPFRHIELELLHSNSSQVYRVIYQRRNQTSWLEHSILLPSEYVFDELLLIKLSKLTCLAVAQDALG